MLMNIYGNMLENICLHKILPLWQKLKQHLLGRSFNMDYNKIEDAVFKKAMDIFKDSASEFFNLDLKIIAPAET